MLSYPCTSKYFYRGEEAKRYGRFICGYTIALISHKVMLKILQARLQLWRVRATLYLRCMGISLRWLLFLHLAEFNSCSLGLQSAGSVVVALRLSCHMACGIFPHQELNRCSLHCKADS